MNLGEKIRHLRTVEGDLRGLQRPLTQKEMLQAMSEELGESLSQGYLSQLEGNKRQHLTAASRDLLARFFKVHPGYLVSDPPDYSTDLLTDIESQDMDRLGTWLSASAEEWHADPVLYDLFQRLADVEEPRRYLAAFRDMMHLSIDEIEAIAVALSPSADTNDEISWEQFDTLSTD